MDLEELIIKLSTDNHITAYEIAKNTSVSANTVRNVLKRANVNTKQKTLLEILDYLQKTITATDNPVELKEEYTTKLKDNHAAEEPADYQTDFNNLKIDDKLNIINKKIDLLLNKLN